jgi:hypothetical protein
MKNLKLALFGIAASFLLSACQTSGSAIVFSSESGNDHFWARNAFSPTAEIAKNIYNVLFPNAQKTGTALVNSGSTLSMAKATTWGIAEGSEASEEGQIYSQVDLLDSLTLEVFYAENQTFLSNAAFAGKTVTVTLSLVAYHDSADQIVSSSEGISLLATLSADNSFSLYRGSLSEQSIITSKKWPTTPTALHLSLDPVHLFNTGLSFVDFNYTKTHFDLSFSSESEKITDFSDATSYCDANGNLVGTPAHLTNFTGAYQHLTTRGSVKLTSEFAKVPTLTGTSAEATASNVLAEKGLVVNAGGAKITLLADDVQYYRNNQLLSSAPEMIPSGSKISFPYYSEFHYAPLSYGVSKTPVRIDL